MRRIVPAIVALALLGSAGSAFAAPCKDAKGKFVKCPPVAAKAVRCKDASGKFAKCSAPGAKPAA